jgi:putative drug exporter of the RND superfamily
VPSPPRAARWLVPVLLLAVWLGLGGVVGPYAGKLSEVSTNEQSAFLPQSAESTRVLQAQKRFQDEQTVPVIVVWTPDDGSVSGRQTRRARATLHTLADVAGVTHAGSPVVPSHDGQALQAVLPLRADLGKHVKETVRHIREQAGDLPGLTAHVTGPAATQADLADAFAGIDSLLLLVALGVVLLILLLVYRSLLLPLIVIISSVLALSLASALVYVLADHGVVRVDGQVQGILSILVIGAATDYALLLAARYKEELAAHRHTGRLQAMTTGPAPGGGRDHGQRRHRRTRPARAAAERPVQHQRARSRRRHRHRLRRREHHDLPARRARPARPGRVLAGPPPADP